MTAKTRYFFVGSALVLVLGLGIGTVAYYGGMPGGLFAASSAPDELRYVPRDAAVVAYANVRDVMQSDLRQRLISLEGSEKQSGRDEFKTETGIDIEHDIDHVVAYMAAGGEGEARPERSGLMLARGRFDEARITALAKEHGGQVVDYKGKRLLTAVGGRKHDAARTEADVDRAHTKMAMCFVEKGLVVMGGEEMVRRAIDAAKAGNSVMDNPDFMKRIEGIRDGSMWAVGHFDSIASQANLPTEVTGRIPPITWFEASGRVNGGMQAMLKAETQTKEAAESLRDIVRGFTALAKMQAGNRPDAQALWPDVQVGGDDTSVEVSFAVSSALLDAVMKGNESRKKSAGVKKTD